MSSLTVASAKCNMLTDFMCAMQLVVYTALLLIGLYALHDQPYLTDSSFFWRGWPKHNIP